MWLSLLAGEQMGRLASHILYPPSEPSRLLQACPFIGQLHMESALSSNIVSANIGLARISHMTESGIEEKVGGAAKITGQGLIFHGGAAELRPSVPTVLARNQTYKQPK